MDAASEIIARYKAARERLTHPPNAHEDVPIKLQRPRGWRGAERPPDPVEEHVEQQDPVVPEPELIDPMVQARLCEDRREMRKAIARGVDPQEVATWNAKPGSFSNLFEDDRERLRWVVACLNRKNRPDGHAALFLVCRAFGVSRATVQSGCRLHRFVVPRQYAAAIAVLLLGWSFPMAGRLLGGRDHTTVLHATRKAGPLVAEVAAELGVALRRQVPARRKSAGRPGNMAQAGQAMFV